MTPVSLHPRQLVTRWRGRRTDLPGPFDLDGFRARADYGDEARSALVVLSIENAVEIASIAGAGVAKRLAADVCAVIAPYLRESDLAAPISDDRVGVVMTELPPYGDAALDDIADRLLAATDTLQGSGGPKPAIRIGIAPADAGILTHNLLQRAQWAIEAGRVNDLRHVVAK